MQNVKISREVLKTALKTAMKTINKNSVLPILETFLLEVSQTPKGFILTVTGTDLENNISITMPCEASEVFSFILPIGELKLIEKLEDEYLTLKAETKEHSTTNHKTKEVEITHTHHVSILTDSDSIVLQSEAPLDFPKIPILENIEFLGAVTEYFYREVKTLQPYASKDTLRPHHCGIFLEIAETGYNLTSTDCHILKTTSLPGDFITMDDKPFLATSYGANNVGAIMPSKFCKFIGGFSGQTNSHIYKTKNNVFLTFLMDGIFEVKISTRAIDGRYPEYRNVIPQNNPIEVTANKKELHKLIDKAMLYTNQVTFLGALHINGDIKIAAQDLDFAKQYNGKMQHIKHTGEDISIGFNLKFMSKILKDISGENVTIELSTPTRAGVIKDGNCTTLCMPVMIEA